jgi:predicted Zn-dependent peptidase
MAITFHQAVLDNGLTIIAEVDPSAHSSAVGFFVKTGARDEDAGVMGVSHFLEHMMFKGTSKRTADEINQAFDRIGAKNNAYTSHEMTCFHASVLPESLLADDGALEVLADMLRPALRQSDFDTEKNVILEEIAMYDDNPFFVLYERSLEEYYTGPGGLAGGGGGDRHGRLHPLGHRVLGNKETIGALTSEQMRSYFDQRYSADNTVVALAGRMDFDRTVDELRRLCSTWRRTGVKRLHGEPLRRTTRFELRDDKVSRAYALLLAPGPSQTDEDRYAAALLSQVLGGADNSRLHWALIETGLADSAECAFDPHDGCGDFMVYLSCDPERAGEVWQIVERELASIERTLSTDDLEKIRCKSATAVTLAGERPGGRMQRLGRQWLAHGSYSKLEDELAKMNAVTLEDVRRVMKRWPISVGTGTLGWLVPGAK